MPSIDNLRVKIFVDGADLTEILALRRNPAVRGFTTNPTLMRKAGVLDYEAFARNFLRIVPDRPVSLEVFADDELEMEEQARTIAAWGGNVNVKIPVTNRDGVFLGPLIRRLSRDGIALNITAILTLEQVERVAYALDPATPAMVSIFAGRIADTGVDPIPVMKDARRILAARPHAKLLWASPREVFNIFQAENAGCDIITVSPEILDKLGLIGRDLAEYSLETVEMFTRDARDAGYSILSAVPA